MGMSRDAPDMIRRAFEKAYREFPGGKAGAAYFGAGILPVVRAGWATLDAIAEWNDLRNVQTSKGPQRQHLRWAVESAATVNRSIGLAMPPNELETTVQLLWEQLRRRAILGIIGASTALQLDDQELNADTPGLAETAKILRDAHLRRRPETIFDHCVAALNSKAGATLRTNYINALTGYASDTFPFTTSDPSELEPLVSHHVAALLRDKLATSGWSTELTDATVHNLTPPEPTSTT